jgi:hypothetical protein
LWSALPKGPNRAGVSLPSPEDGKVQRLWSALPKGPNRAGVSLPSPEDGKVQRLWSALPKGPNRAGVSLPSPEDGNRSSFLNVVFFLVICNSGGWKKSRNAAILLHTIVRKLQILQAGIIQSV